MNEIMMVSVETADERLEEERSVKSFTNTLHDFMGTHSCTCIAYLLR